MEQINGREGAQGDLEDVSRAQLTIKETLERMSRRQVERSHSGAPPFGSRTGSGPLMSGPLEAGSKPLEHAGLSAPLTPVVRGGELGRAWEGGGWEGLQLVDGGGLGGKGW